jgi:hypothetical protein
LAFEYAVLAGRAAKFIPGAIVALAKARAAFTANAGFVGEALLIAIAGAVGLDARFVCTYILPLADIPFLAALLVAAGSDRTASATTVDGPRKPIPAALALEADLIVVAAAIVCRPRLFMLADRPTVRFAADWMILIGHAIDQHRDKAVCTARVAAHLAALALDAARLPRRTSTVALAAGRDAISPR